MDMVGIALRSQAFAYAFRDLVFGPFELLPDALASPFALMPKFPWLMLSTVGTSNLLMSIAALVAVSRLLRPFCSGFLYVAK